MSRVPGRGITGGGLGRAALAPRWLRPWLREPGPLLPALARGAGGAVRVRPLRTGPAPLRPHERCALGGRRWGYVREVVLEGPRGPLAWARSACEPRLLARGAGRQLARLGTRPLTGWLHRRGGPRLLGREVRAVAGGWVRRSLYRLHGARLLVEERFSTGRGAG